MTLWLEAMDLMCLAMTLGVSGPRQKFARGSARDTYRDPGSPRVAGGQGSLAELVRDLVRGQAGGNGIQLGVIRYLDGDGAQAKAFRAFARSG